MLKFFLVIAKFFVALSHLIFLTQSLLVARATSLCLPLWGRRRVGVQFLRPNTRLPPFYDSLQMWLRTQARQHPKLCSEGEVTPQQKEVASEE